MLRGHTKLPARLLKAHSSRKKRERLFSASDNKALLLPKSIRQYPSLATVYKQERFSDSFSYLFLLQIINTEEVGETKAELLDAEIPICVSICLDLSAASVWVRESGYEWVRSR